MSDLNAVVLISGKTTAGMHKDSVAEDSTDCIGEFDVTLLSSVQTVVHSVWDLHYTREIKFLSIYAYFVSHSRFLFV
jgi:hypothetical protein